VSQALLFHTHSRNVLFGTQVGSLRISALGVSSCSCNHWRQIFKEEHNFVNRPPSLLTRRARMTTRALLTAMEDMFSEDSDLEICTWLTVEHDIRISTGIISCLVTWKSAFLVSWFRQVTLQAQARRACCQYVLAFATRTLRRKPCIQATGYDKLSKFVLAEPRLCAYAETWSEYTSINLRPHCLS